MRHCTQQTQPPCRSHLLTLPRAVSLRKAFPNPPPQGRPLQSAERRRCHHVYSFTFLRGLLAYSSTIGTYSPTLGFPALDQVPPINSTEVQQWIAEVKASGVQIPNIPLSVDGSCASDPAKVANQSICWWTCGGCTRETDVTTCPDKVCSNPPDQLPGSHLHRRTLDDMGP